MKRMGMCWKCLEWKEVRDHHAYGYETDETKPYCRSCDRKAHNKDRREGRCSLTGIESHRKSIRSRIRRLRICGIKQMISFRETVLPNIQLYEHLEVNLNTRTVTIISGFLGNHKKLYVIEER